MNRRKFLTSTMLGTLGLGAASVPARAFSLQDCAEDSSPACREVAKHRDLITEINAMLAKKGLDEQQRQAVLAKAVCPFCGLPLMG